MKAEIFASESPGGKKVRVAQVEIDVLAGWDRVISETYGGAQQYWVISLDGVNDVVILPPGVPLAEATRLAKVALRGEVYATFRPQAWIRDYAVEQDGREVFNALPALLKMDLTAVQRLFAQGSDFDCLADDLPARRDHNGPFEVDIDESALVEMVCLLSSNHGALGEHGRMGDVTQSLWDEFSRFARAILQLHADQRNAAKPPASWDDFVDRFRPVPQHRDAHDAFFLRDLIDPEVLRVIQEDPRCIWTSLDVDGQETVASGVHHVNRMGYYLCAVPYTGPDCDFDASPDSPPQTWGELVDRFEPIPVPVARDPGNLLRSSLDPDLRRVSDSDPACIWTVLDVGGAEKIVNGFQDVSGAAHILCKVPYCGRDCEIAGDSGPADVLRQRG